MIELAGDRTRHSGELAPISPAAYRLDRIAAEIPRANAELLRYRTQRFQSPEITHRFIWAPFDGAPATSATSSAVKPSG